MTVQEQIAVEQDDLEREIGKKNQTSLLEKGTIRAQEDGVLYLNPEGINLRSSQKEHYWLNYIHY